MCASARAGLLVPTHFHSAVVHLGAHPNCWAAGFRLSIALAFWHRNSCEAVHICNLDGTCSQHSHCKTLLSGPPSANDKQIKAEQLTNCEFY